MAARAGFEPATKWLTATCSTTELPGKDDYDIRCKNNAFSNRCQSEVFAAAVLSQEALVDISSMTSLS